jgi:hypothetical protein
MQYPDDKREPEPSSFFSDGSGGIFDAHDLDPSMIWQSPTTHERVVDTQSGFLVVLKRGESERLLLSVKRRLGTPPSSSIALTPDECLKLSKILAGNWDPERIYGSVSDEAQAYLRKQRARFNSNSKIQLTPPIIFSLIALVSALGLAGGFALAKFLHY